MRFSLSRVEAGAVSRNRGAFNWSVGPHHLTLRTVAGVASVTSSKNRVTESESEALPPFAVLVSIPVRHTHP